MTTFEQAKAALAALTAWFAQTQPAPEPAAPPAFVSPNAATARVVLPDAVILPGERVATVTVRLAEAVARPVAVQVQARNGKGTYAPFHYPAGQAAWVLFQPGETEKTVRFATLRDLGIGNTMQLLAGWGTGHPATATGAEGVVVERATREAAPARALPQPAFPGAAGSEGRALVFSSIFMEPIVPGDVKGAWRSRPAWGRVQTGNRELAPYTDPSTDAGVNPFPIVAGKRVLRAEYLPGGVRDEGRIYDYSAPMLDSTNLVTITEGYVELCGTFARTPGSMYAFWLVPADQTWPPEVDIFEVGLGGNFGFASTIHDARFDQEGLVLPGADIADGRPHCVGHDITRDWHVTFVDGREAVRRPNLWPGRAWRIIVNQSIGGISPAPVNPQPGWHTDWTLDTLKVWR